MTFDIYSVLILLILVQYNLPIHSSCWPYQAPPVVHLPTQIHDISCRRCDPNAYAPKHTMQKYQKRNGIAQCRLSKCQSSLWEDSRGYLCMQLEQTIAVAAGADIDGGTEGIDGNRCRYDTKSLDGNKGSLWWKTEEYGIQRRPITFFDLSYTTYVMDTAGTTFKRLGVSPLNSPRTPSP